MKKNAFATQFFSNCKSKTRKTSILKLDLLNNFESKSKILHPNMHFLKIFTSTIA
jgi:hypothetical protein